MILLKSNIYDFSASFAVWISFCLTYEIVHPVIKYIAWNNLGIIWIHCDFLFIETSSLMSYA